MSLRYEQYRSLAMTRDLLRDLATSRATSPAFRIMRGRASACLRHFPPLMVDGEPLFSRDSLTAPDNHIVDANKMVRPEGQP